MVEWFKCILLQFQILWLQIHIITHEDFSIMRVSHTASTGQESSGSHHAPQAVHLQAAANQPCLCPCQTRATSLAKLCQSPIGPPGLTILTPLQASFILTHRLGREFNFIHYVRESMDDDFSKWVLQATLPGTSQHLLTRL